jgi:hypothetical protein
MFPISGPREPVFDPDAAGKKARQLSRRQQTASTMKLRR